MSSNLKPDTLVICHSGCIVSKYYMPKHLKTKKHEHEMIGRKGIEIVNHYQHKPRNLT